MRPAIFTAQDMDLKRLIVMPFALLLAGCGAIEIGFEPTGGPAVAAMTQSVATTEDRAATGTPAPTLTQPAPPTPGDIATASVEAPASDTPAASACAARHIVKTGDTLMTIGQAYGADWHAIAAANNLASPSLIFAGQSLCIPNAVRTPNPATATSALTGTPTVTATHTEVLSPTVSPTTTLTPTPCATEWFFTPAPTECPNGAAQSSSGAAERFERGQMIWSAANDTYIVLFNLGATAADGRLVFIRLQTLALKPGADVDNRIDETPQPGLVQPVRGFGHIWRDEVYGDFAVLGGQTMRAAIGWAVEPEYAITTAIQCAVARPDASQICYLRAPGERIIALESSASGNLWWYQVGP